MVSRKNSSVEWHREIQIGSQSRELQMGTGGACEETCVTLVPLGRNILSYRLNWEEPSQLDWALIKAPHPSKDGIEMKPIPEMVQRGRKQRGSSGLEAVPI